MHGCGECTHGTCCYHVRACDELPGPMHRLPPEGRITAGAMLQLSEEPQRRRQDHHRPPTMPSCFPARQMWRQHPLHDHVRIYINFILYIISPTLVILSLVVKEIIVWYMWDFYAMILTNFFYVVAEFYHFFFSWIEGKKLFLVVILLIKCCK